ncbi:MULTISPECIES: hypothetical protein [Bradyrhizobium]|jgi:hypothetical protein|uniref:hypothetical protein n=1 Tax=Bradyrhizobium TaxID=374 RepID=UPI0003AA3BBC|nr:hypothetical protein [Bradyrhizobium denitrificans]MCL8489374.1 hypothetical protein [Bradyrhizobium denitrificans]
MYDIYTHVAVEIAEGLALYNENDVKPMRDGYQVDDVFVVGTAGGLKCQRCDAQNCRHTVAACCSIDLRFRKACARVIEHGSVNPPAIGEVNRLIKEVRIIAGRRAFFEHNTEQPLYEYAEAVLGACKASRPLLDTEKRMMADDYLGKLLVRAYLLKPDCTVAEAVDLMSGG